MTMTILSSVVVFLIIVLLLVALLLFIKAKLFYRKKRINDRWERKHCISIIPVFCTAFSIILLVFYTVLKS